MGLCFLCVPLWAVGLCLLWGGDRCIDLAYTIRDALEDGGKAIEATSK